MTGWRVTLGVCLVSAVTAIGPVSAADDDAAQFFRGKSIDLMIGAPAGGGYDAYARVLARHFSEHMAGNPAIVPRNLPGASANKAMAFVYGVAAKDGTVIGAISSGAIMEPLLGDKLADVAPAKMIYLGSANREVFLCFTRADSPVKTLKDALDKRAILAASAEGGSSRDFPALLDNVLGAKFRIVSGYPGTRDMTLAVERGEADGMCGYAWSSLSTSQPQWLSEHKINLLAQETIKGHPALDALGVPLAIDFAKTTAERQVMELVYGQLVFGRPYALPGGVPSARVAALRAAFMAAMKDEALLADAAKMRIEIAPVAGDEVQAMVEKMYALPPAVVEGAKKALVYREEK